MDKGNISHKVMNGVMVQLQIILTGTKTMTLCQRLLVLMWKKVDIGTTSFAIRPWDLSVKFQDHRKTVFKVLVSLAYSCRKLTRNYLMSYSKSKYYIISDY